MKKQTGFTIIELVVVIALLGILAATALPRFINVTDDAHNAAVKGAAGGFAAGIALAKAQAVVDNAVSGAGVQLEGTVSVAVNESGYPVGASNSAPADLTALGDDDCVEIWDAVLQGSRPTASTASTSEDGVDYSTVNSTGNDECVYTYRQANNGTDRVITYNSTTGNVTVTGSDET